MKNSILIIILAILFASCADESIRTIEDFNFNWKFAKGDYSEAQQVSFDDVQWDDVDLPHDWSILTGYQKDKAASTGFSDGGIAWYRKAFQVPQLDKDKTIWIEFDGVYCNSEVYINGEKLGFRPNGYASFSYYLSKHLNYGGNNVISVKVDHTAYVDSRWYTGSGIYRDVRLVKTSKVHIPQWGVQITTPSINEGEATVQIETKIDGAADDIEVEISIVDQSNTVCTSGSASIVSEKNAVVQEVKVPDPQLWGVKNPNLYTAQIAVKHKGTIVDQVEQRFGIREFRFDSKKGFYLNGENLKIKGVNIHHDVGAVGAAATKASWGYRITKLKSIGVNAVRMAHNPHSPLLMEVCDEMGMLVMNEFFDEWHKPKGKSVMYLGDEAAGHDISKGYSDVFSDWAEKDLKTLIRRDFNHPSVILWSIGNEIEWTFPDYAKTFGLVNPNIDGYHSTPLYDTDLITKTFEEVTGGVDSLAIVAKLLAKWVKEEDTTRPTICGSVIPSVSMMSGYGEAVDILGLNYRAADYDAFHQTFPDKPIIGSENWVAYSEWKACVKRDFIPGIFVWTGFAYLGEAGPWPRKGLNISFFDFAGFKTPRGHFFECLWKPDPKVYMVTTPASESEFSYSEEEGWKFDIQLTPPPVWNKLRLWEWYKVNEHWNYKKAEEIIVQTYTNCEEAELFLNGESLGKQSLSDFSEDDNIIKWSVPYEKGELKVVAYNNGNVADEYILASTGKLARIEIESDKAGLQADGYDVTHVSVRLLDDAGNEIKDLDTELVFKVEGKADLLAVDNGWEKNVNSHHTNKLITHNGRALAIIKSSLETGNATVMAYIGDIKSNSLTIEVK